MTLQRNGLRLGAISLWGGPDVTPFRDEVRLAELLGYSVLGVGDSPAGWHDMTVALTVAGLTTERATITPMVTTPHLRHPVATTLAMSALHDLTGGRAVCTIGSGGGVGAGIGQPAATLATMRAYLGAVRDLSRGVPTSWNGGHIPFLAQARPFPLFMSADGPKALRMAGELADGVVISIGSSIEPIAAKIAAVRAGAASAGRDPAAVDVWAMSFCSIQAMRSAAVADVTAFLAVIAGLGTLSPQAMAAIPDDLVSRVEEMQRRYDPTQHVVVGGANARLIEQLELVEFFAGGNAIAGNADEVADHLRVVADLGISCLIVALPGNADPAGTLHRMMAARNREAAGPTATS